MDWTTAILVAQSVFCVLCAYLVRRNVRIQHLRGWMAGRMDLLNSMQEAQRRGMTESEFLISVVEKDMTMARSIGIDVEVEIKRIEKDDRD